VKFTLNLTYDRLKYDSQFWYRIHRACESTTGLKFSAGFSVSHENNGPTEARIGGRFSPTIKAITAKSKGDVRFNMESFSVVKGSHKLPRAFILTLR
jgi:hypothetical protein